LSPSSQNVGEHLSHTATDIVPAWKNELSERLAATRTRKLLRNKEEQIALPGLEDVQRKPDSRAALLAAKVAQRYANAPSYSELLAAESRTPAEAEAATAAPADVDDIPIAPQPSTERPSPQYLGESAAEEKNVPEPRFIEEEQVFGVVEPLAVNVIDFPRELVAARRLRPRLAEGPLREEKDQLRIFEVAPETISQTVSVAKVPANWSPIRLDNDPVDAPRREFLAPQPPLKTAPLGDRIMAGIFDLALIVAAFAVFVLVFVACTAHPPTGKPALLAAGVVLAGFCVLYQYLFFKYAEGTPGMHYAKIALCTFEDENPTRKAMCKRVWFLLLSVAPLGLGLAWALFDPDRLSWHDRLSRIYQRSYS
jgi:uncharacterized RDD family membrane protein YckC